MGCDYRRGFLLLIGFILLFDISREYKLLFVKTPISVACIRNYLQTYKVLKSYRLN